MDLMELLRTSDIDNALKTIKIMYERLNTRFERLNEENEKLKSGVYKDEELQRLKKELDDVYSCMLFKLTEEGVRCRDEFISKHKCGKSANAHYTIYPTGLGDVIYYECGCGEKVIIDDQI